MKTIHLGIRIDEHLAERLNNVSMRAGVEKPTLVREAIKALVNYVEQTSRVTFPLVMIEPESQPLKAAEERGRYGPAEKS